MNSSSSGPESANTKEGLYLALFSLHGLVRAENWELGRDADTGGQIRYVVELARALGEHPEVGRVDLITRQIIDPRVDEIYAQTRETITDKVTLHRIPFGPRRYLRKEKLWPYLDIFVDHMIAYFRRQGRVPDILHGHYADAGQAAGQLARLLGVPFVFTGHSLGRVKRERLLAQGKDGEELEERYALRTRVEAEEYALETASLVVASTFQEVEDQYQHYDHYVPDRMEVIPPGVDLSSFSTKLSPDDFPALKERIGRFLEDPSKPIILLMARPDERKNLAQLLHVYGQSAELRERANLVLILGHREDIRQMAPAQRRIIAHLLILIDTYDLYRKVAYPKSQTPDEVPALYRLAAESGGVFVNIALTEPFGLTLLEAGASGLPVVTTNDGGPRDILANCRHGLLVDPLDQEAIEKALLSALDDRERYEEWVKAGVKGTREHYAWATHVDHYMREVLEIHRKAEDYEQPFGPKRGKRSLPDFDRLLITDIDNTLTGDAEGFKALIEELREHSDRVGFGIASGRSLGDLKKLLGELDLPTPDVVISSAGTELHYGRSLSPDRSWNKHIRYQWQPGKVRAALAEVPGLHLQDEKDQSPTKISYQIDPEVSPSLPEIHQILRSAGLRTKALLSHGIFLDVIPTRAGPGLCIRHLGIKWGFALERLLVAGDSGNDEEMLRGGTLGIVVGNYSPELEHLRGRPRIHFTEASHAWGVLEGIRYYDFFGSIQIPNDHLRQEPVEEHDDEDDDGSSNGS
jgi:sucrose-phosphate synthase